MWTELIAYQHMEDLRREAADYRRSHAETATRADRAATRGRRRSFFTLHRRRYPMGCEA